MAEWKYNILKPIFNQIIISGVKYILYTQTVAFEKIGDGNCVVYLNGKKLTLDASKTIIIKRVISKSSVKDGTDRRSAGSTIGRSNASRDEGVGANKRLDIYNAMLHYSYIDHILRTINDKIDLRKIQLTTLSSNPGSRGIATASWSDFTGSLQNIINQAEKSTKSEIVGEIESLLNPGFN